MSSFKIIYCEFYNRQQKDKISELMTLNSCISLKTASLFLDEAQKHVFRSIELSCDNFLQFFWNSYVLIIRPMWHFDSKQGKIFCPRFAKMHVGVTFALPKRTRVLNRKDSARLRDHYWIRQEAQAENKIRTFFE